MSPADSSHEVEFIWGDLVGFGADDDHIREFHIQLSEEIGRLNRGSLDICLLAECSREQMAAHRIAIDNQDEKFRCNIRFEFLSFVFPVITPTTRGSSVLMVVFRRRLS